MKNNDDNIEEVQGVYIKKYSRFKNRWILRDLGESSMKQQNGRLNRLCLHIMRTGSIRLINVVEKTSIKSVFSLINQMIINQLPFPFKSEAFLLLGTVRPHVCARQLALFVNLGILELITGITYLAVRNFVKMELYNQYKNISMKILNMTILAFLIY